MLLPIHDVIPDIQAKLASANRLLVEAAPGAGKTTVVPLELLREEWLSGRKIVLLEPRRLAARAAARRMAAMLGEQVGDTVGYRIRMERKISAKTRIEVVTEGILTRQIQHDPELSGVGLIIFDEFHERSLQADLGLALALDVQQALRPDLRIVTMSATPECDRLTSMLAMSLVKSDSKCHPIETRYLGDFQSHDLVREVSRAALVAAAEQEGSILVFLPGAGEISRVAEALRDCSLPANTVIAPLYAGLPQEQQDLAIEPTPSGKRKIVLATNIAESSLTIEGITVVVDSGLVRVPRYNPNSGLTRLETVKVSRASADQRRGRAGRVAPGTCYRLWSEPANQGLAAHAVPEVLSADLASLILELAQWGVKDPTELSWLDPPPEAACQEASKLLQKLDAVSENCSITDLGRRMLEFGTHPRLAHMIIRGEERGEGELACVLAALLSEGDVLRMRDRQAMMDSDIQTRIDVLKSFKLQQQRDVAGYSVDGNCCRRVLEQARQWTRKLGGKLGQTWIGHAGLLLAFAYPDRIARKREKSDLKYLLECGSGARFVASEPLSQNEFLVAAHLDGQSDNARIYLAAALDRKTIDDELSDSIHTVELVEWDTQDDCVKYRLQSRLGAIVLKDAPLRNPSQEAMTAAVIEGIRTLGLESLPWTKELRAWQQRVLFLHRLIPDDWPDLSDDALLAKLESWLEPFVAGITRRAQFQKIDLVNALHATLDWKLKSSLDNLAPSHLTVPSGSAIRLDYSGAVPILKVRIQQIFGMSQTPAVVNGKVPVLLHILSPAMRPVQVTSDLESFWQTTYDVVRKDLKGRYPKHYWPDNPLVAEPTNRAKPRR